MAASRLFVAALALFVLGSPAPAAADGQGPIKVIFTDAAPPPVAPYTQARVFGNTIYLAGQLPITCDAACWAAVGDPPSPDSWTIASTKVTTVAKCTVAEAAAGCTDPSGAAPVADQAAQTTAQAKQVMDNLKAVLEAAGATFDDVTKCVVYQVAGGVNGPAFNAVYASYFSPDRRPARVAINISSLALSSKLEVECTAVKANQ